METAENVESAELLGRNRRSTACTARWMASDDDDGDDDDDDDDDDG